MQQKDKKTSFLAKTVGKTIKELRLKEQKYSINQMAHEYDLDVGNISRIENGLTDIKLVTLWKIAEALKKKPSDILTKIERTIGDDFHFYDI